MPLLNYLKRKIWYQLQAVLMFFKKIFTRRVDSSWLIPLFEKEDPNNKTNYWPISLLSIISKIFERVLFGQIEKFAKKMLSPKLRGFRNVHSTQHTLLYLLNILQEPLDKSDVVDTVLIDLSKAYNCRPHDLHYSQVGYLWFQRIGNIFNIWLPF